MAKINSNVWEYSEDDVPEGCRHPDTLRIINLQSFVQKIRVAHMRAKNEQSYRAMDNLMRDIEEALSYIPIGEVKLDFTDYLINNTKV